MQFKDAFLSLIDKDEALTDVQELQYLRGMLKEEALQFVEGLETTAENYKIAWELLTKHYKNQRLIINKHLKELVETASIAKGSGAAIRQFVNHLRMHVKALGTLKLPVQQWDAILIYLASTKLDYHTRREWEEHIRQAGLSEVPRMEELLEFLTGKYHMLEMVEKEKSTSEAHKHNEKKRERSIALASTSGQECEYCKGEHRIYGCENY